MFCVWVRFIFPVCTPNVVSSFIVTTILQISPKFWRLKKLQENLVLLDIYYLKSPLKLEKTIDSLLFLDRSVSPGGADKGTDIVGEM